MPAQDTRDHDLGGINRSLRTIAKNLYDIARQLRLLNANLRNDATLLTAEGDEEMEDDSEMTVESHI